MTESKSELKHIDPIVRLLCTSVFEIQPAFLRRLDDATETLGMTMKAAHFDKPISDFVGIILEFFEWLKEDNFRAQREILSKESDANNSNKFLQDAIISTKPNVARRLFNTENTTENRSRFQRGFEQFLFHIPYAPSIDGDDPLKVHVDKWSKESDGAERDALALLRWTRASKYKKLAWLFTCFTSHGVGKPSIFDSPDFFTRCGFDDHDLKSHIESIRQIQTPTTPANWHNVLLGWIFRPMYLNDSFDEPENDMLPSNHQMLEFVESFHGLNLQSEHQFNFHWRSTSLVIEAWAFQTNPHSSYRKDGIALILSKIKWLRKKLEDIWGDSK